MNYQELRKLIKAKTGCTAVQARYLAKEMLALPKVLKTFVDNLDNMNLYNCANVEVVRVCGYMDDCVNVIGERIKDQFSYLGETYTLYNYYKHCMTHDGHFSKEVY